MATISHVLTLIEILLDIIQLWQGKSSKRRKKKEPPKEVTPNPPASDPPIPPTIYIGQANIYIQHNIEEK